ncbi:uncharacterized protein METZ01_LOCUS2666 [marine metagenome]|uniref:Uncharacterized protein n=1 Tax=marine metagenome TaxID=408172 RepID=A0A381N5D3_9ZZZZ
MAAGIAQQIFFRSGHSQIILNRQMGFRPIDTVKRPPLTLEVDVLRISDSIGRGTLGFLRGTPWWLAGWSPGGTVAQWLERALHKR